MQQVSQSRPQIGVVQFGIFLTTLVTASAHLFLASKPEEELRFWFLLNGIGYIVLLIAFFLPQLARIHSTVRWMFIGYTLLTIVLWFFQGSPSHGGPWDPFDVIIKLVEVTLVAFLFLETRYHTKQRI
ncbi:MAG: hypothetical protein NVS4B1_24070 [Ktedonobacteraceae bacterium]